SRPMAEYVLLVNWTEQGIKNVKESSKRLDGGKALAEKLGCKITKFYMTFGVYDQICTIEAPNDEALAKYVLTLSQAGNIRVTTLKAFSEPSYREIISSLE